MGLDFLLFQKLLVALLLGALVGLEREHGIQEGKTKFYFAGIRTFALFSLLGAVAQMFFADPPVFLWIITVAIFALAVSGYILTARKAESFGATTELATFGIYLIGIIAGRGEFFSATALTLIILIILHFKSPLHKLASSVNKEEITSTVKFLIIAFIILPLLPNENYGPYGFFNPQLVWLMVVFISGISFASYLGVKFFGQKKGIGLAGFFAGFISSTALTLSFSDESKKHPYIINPFVFAIVLASSAMFFRILVEVSVLNPALFFKMLIPIGVMGVTGTALAIYTWTRKEKAADTATEKSLKTHAEKLRSPFTLSPALKFAAFFTAILFVSQAMSELFGEGGIYLTSLLSSLLDVDAITVSLSRLSAESQITMASAGVGLFIAAATNTVVKGLLFLFLGNKRVAKSILVIFGIILLVGLASFLVVS